MTKTEPPHLNVPLADALWDAITGGQPTFAQGHERVCAIVARELETRAAAARASQLAGHLADQPADVVQAALRLIGIALPREAFQQVGAQQTHTYPPGTFGPHVRPQKPHDVRVLRVGHAPPYDPEPWHGSAPDEDHLEDPAEVKQLRAQLARLHEGEEPHHDGATTTPAQWIWHWNRATPQQRLEAAAVAISNAERAGRCFLEAHEKRLAAPTDAQQHVRGLDREQLHQAIRELGRTDPVWLRNTIRAAARTEGSTP